MKRVNSKNKVKIQVIWYVCTFFNISEWDLRVSTSLFNSLRKRWIEDDDYELLTTNLYLICIKIYGRPNSGIFRCRRTIDFYSQFYISLRNFQFSTTIDFFIVQFIN